MRSGEVDDPPFVGDDYYDDAQHPAVPSVSGAEGVELRYEDDGGCGLLVLSFDPGVTTGWAVHRLDLKVLMASGFQEALRSAASGYALGELRGQTENEMVDEMVAMTRSVFTLGDYAAGDHFAIVMEDFILRRSESDRSLLAPVRVFSKYEYALDVLTRGKVALPYVKQSASDAKTIVTDDRLIRWGVYRPGSVHARDAQRHGILFSRKVASNPALLGRLKVAML